MGDRSFSEAAEGPSVVTVTLYGPIRETVGRKTISVEGETVGEIIDALCERYPDLTEEIFVDGRVRSSVQLFLDGRKVAPLGGLEAPVDPEADLQITAAMSGG